MTKKMAYFNSFIVIKKKHFGIIEEDLSKMNGQVIYNDDYIASLYTGRIPIETDLNKSDFLNISINSNNIDIRINGDLQIKDFVDFKIELFYRLGCLVDKNFFKKLDDIEEGKFRDTSSEALHDILSYLDDDDYNFDDFSNSELLCFQSDINVLGKSDILEDMFNLICLFKKELESYKEFYYLYCIYNEFFFETGEMNNNLLNPSILLNILLEDKFINMTNRSIEIEDI